MDLDSICSSSNILGRLGNFGASEWWSRWSVTAHFSVNETSSSIFVCLRAEYVLFCSPKGSAFSVTQPPYALADLFLPPIAHPQNLHHHLIFDSSLNHALWLCTKISVSRVPKSDYSMLFVRGVSQRWSANLFCLWWKLHAVSAATSSSISTFEKWCARCR